MEGLNRDLFNKYVERSPGPLSERAEVLQYFMDAVNSERKSDGRSLFPFGFFAAKCTGIPTCDLYALISKMKDGGRRDKSAAMIFFSELKAPKETI